MPPKPHKAIVYAKKNAWNGIAITLVSLLASTVWPTIEGWHNDKMQAEAIAAAVAPIQKELDSFKAEQERKDVAQWQKISELIAKKK